jgi:hypothetical protein
MGTDEVGFDELHMKTPQKRKKAIPTDDKIQILKSRKKASDG